MFIVKTFQKPKFSVKQSLQTLLLRVPWTIDIIFHFILTVILLSFNFHMYLESSVLLTYFLWRKTLEWFLQRSLNVYAIPKYCLSGLLDLDFSRIHCCLRILGIAFRLTESLFSWRIFGLSFTNVLWNLFVICNLEVI